MVTLCLIFLPLLFVFVSHLLHQTQLKTDKGFWKSKVEVVSLERLIPDLSPSLNGTKIVVLSDIHWSENPRLCLIHPKFFLEVVQIAKDLKPDLVFLLGDLVNNDPKSIDSLIPQLLHIAPRSGIWAVLGNHDDEHSYTRVGRQYVSKALEEAQIHVLTNDVAYPLGKDLQVVGLGDLWSQEFHPLEIMPRLNPKLPTLVLSHNPDTAHMLRKWRVDLQLSGHTHGGQISLPFIGPLLPYLYLPLRWLLPHWMGKWVPFMKFGRVLRNLKYLGRGLYPIEKEVNSSSCPPSPTSQTAPEPVVPRENWLYVNAGLATTGPVRIGVPPEITVVILKTK